ncbi:MAG TPA: hypothetical protein VGS97_20185 [Actinocrinis sp.]|uniref:hypothetical protein n=1 Tax=Actinocrinis sp. TaxID=1920516 RepID=UPI002DDD352C|nr:hypothetical protein [Actinocrinis sp.]HEV2346429.1 hypothetical protein [Actinocrinis sp.]
MTATTNQHAIDLMPQLRDVLGLPKDLDLPPLYSAAFTAYHNAPGWTVRAQLGSLPDAEAWEALKAWAPGAERQLDDPTESEARTSGWYRKAWVDVRIGDVAVQIWCHVEGAFEPPAEILHRDEGEAVSWGYKEGIRKTSCGYKRASEVTDIEADVTCEDCHAMLKAATEAREEWAAATSAPIESTYSDPAVRSAIADTLGGRP